VLNECLPFCPGPRSRNNCRTHGFCNLERGNPDAALCRCDDDEISCAELGLLNQGAPCRDVLQPGCCSHFERDVLRMLDKIASRHVGQFSVGAPPGYIGRRDQTDNIALLEGGYGCPNGFDDRMRFGFSNDFDCGSIFKTDWAFP